MEKDGTFSDGTFEEFAAMLIQRDADDALMRRKALFGAVVVLARAMASGQISADDLRKAMEGIA